MKENPKKIKESISGKEGLTDSEIKTKSRKSAERRL